VDFPLICRNVLITHGSDGKLRVVVSDFGIARRLENDQSSFAATVNNLGGTFGWRAPECVQGHVRLNERSHRLSNSSSSSSDSIAVLSSADNEPRKDHARLTKAVDLFALGCLYFWTVMGGQHPFGYSYLDIDVNIIAGNPVNMKQMENVHREDGAQIGDIVRKLVSLDPASRSVPISRQSRQLTIQAKNIGMFDTPLFLGSRETPQIPLRRF
jgi:serine/threonine-protein kinase/endoribonuclease IRE1